MSTELKSAVPTIQNSQKESHDDQVVMLLLIGSYGIFALISLVGHFIDVWPDMIQLGQTAGLTFAPLFMMVVLFRLQARISRLENRLSAASKHQTGE